MKKFYVYVLYDPRTDEPFYVGAGQGNRMFEHEKRVVRGKICNEGNYYLTNKIKNILFSGNQIKYKVVYRSDKRENILSKEKKLIKQIGKFNDKVPGPLCNITEGGIGGTGRKPGFKHSSETKKKQSESASKRIISPEGRKKRSIAFKGKQNPFFGKSHTNETKKYLKKINIGKSDSEETKIKKSEFQKKRYEDPKEREKMKELSISFWNSEKGKELKEYNKLKNKKIWEIKKLVNLILFFHGYDISPKQIKLKIIDNTYEIIEIKKNCIV